MGGLSAYCLSITLAISSVLISGCNSSEETLASTSPEVPAVTTPSPTLPPSATPTPLPNTTPDPVPTLAPIPSNVPTLPPTPAPTTPPTPTPIPPTPGTPSIPTQPPLGPASKKALLIGVDGVQYDVLLDALANKQLTNIAQLNLSPSYAGGIAGSSTQQQTLSGPGWASILSGSWANRHEVRSDYAGQVFKTDSVFKQLNQAQSTSISSWSTLNKLLKLDINTGQLSNVIDCAGFDSCVLSSTQTAINSGNFNLVVSNFHAPEESALHTGLGKDYKQTLKTLDQQLGVLIDTIKKRQEQNNEDWLLILTSSHGLSEGGNSDGLPRPSNQAGFIAINKPLAEKINGVPLKAPANIADWYSYASQADIAPTVLNYLSVNGKAENHKMDGVSLLEAPAVKQLQARANPDRSSITLSWKSQLPVNVYRNGKLIKELPAGVTNFTDSALDVSKNGLYKFNYTISSGKTLTSYLAQIDYVKPAALDESILAGLAQYFSLDSTLNANKTNPALTSFIAGRAANYVNGPLANKALQSTSNGATPQCASCDGGFKTPLVVDFTKNSSFTVGFWFRSDALRNDVPVIANKDYKSGTNMGFAFGQYLNSIKFNIGDGKNRVDPQLSFTANSWVYLVMSVDSTKKTAQVFIADPNRPLQTTTANLSAFDLSKFTGLNVLGINEDAQGNYFTAGKGGAAGSFDFSDLAIWNRALSQDDVMGLATTGKSLKSFNP
ncbi:MAG: hypothetical protein K2Q15_10010 [Burkholderiales bacterium]|nr:hypothetical protein [Burkholderiales bacterium]